MKPKKHYVDIIFIIVLIAIFALSSVTLAMLGVNVYKTAGTNSGSQNLSTASLYFAQQVRQCEDKGTIRVASLSGEVPALVIGSVSGGKELETWFYVNDDSLKEVTVRKGKDVDPSYGQDVMTLKSADFEIVDEDLLQISMTADDGTTTSMNLYLTGGGSDE